MKFSEKSKLGIESVKETKKETLESNIAITSKKKIEISGVLELFSSSEIEVKLQTSLGKLKIVGENLKPEQLNLDTQILIVSGDIEGVSYFGLANKQTFFKKVFK